MSSLLLADHKAAVQAGAAALRDHARSRRFRTPEETSPAAKRRGMARRLWRDYLECLTAQDRARGAMARPRWGGKSERYAAERMLQRLQDKQAGLEKQIDAIEAAIALDRKDTR